MATPDSSTELRCAVDTVATARHETAFQLLDLYNVLAHRAPSCAGSRARAQQLAADLAELTAQIDPPVWTPDGDLRR